jgi:hydroxyacylglutathione hydrolase
MTAIIPISAFADNYIWLLREGGVAAVVDPGDAAPVLAYLERERLELAAIVNTHHHGSSSAAIRCSREAAGR